jgi:hypothetical protein
MTTRLEDWDVAETRYGGRSTAAEWGGDGEGFYPRDRRRARPAREQGLSKRSAQRAIASNWLTHFGVWFHFTVCTQRVPISSGDFGG